MIRLLFALALSAGAASAAAPASDAFIGPRAIPPRAMTLDEVAAYAAEPALPKGARVLTLDELGEFGKVQPAPESPYAAFRRRALDAVPGALAFALTVAALWFTAWIFRASIVPFVRRAVQIALGFGAFWFALRLIHWAWETPVF